MNRRAHSIRRQFAELASCCLIKKLFLFHRVYYQVRMAKLIFLCYDLIILINILQQIIETRSTLFAQSIHVYAVQIFYGNLVDFDQNIDCIILMAYQSTFPFITEWKICSIH